MNALHAKWVTLCKVGGALPPLYKSWGGISPLRPHPQTPKECNTGLSGQAMTLPICVHLKKHQQMCQCLFLDLFLLSLLGVWRYLSLNSIGRVDAVSFPDIL